MRTGRPVPERSSSLTQSETSEDTLVAHDGHLDHPACFVADVGTVCVVALRRSLMPLCVPLEAGAAERRRSRHGECRDVARGALIYDPDAV